VHVGEAVAALATATGKVLLAGIEQARVDDVLARLVADTGVDPAELRRDLIRVRSAGVAVVGEEFRAGLAGVAVPIRGPRGEVAGAIGLSVPQVVLLARRPELERVLREAAAGTVTGARAVGRGS
jgi:IclR family transcriptional regulator, acetate operon repressor